MQKHKNKIIAIGIIILILAVSWVWGGSYSRYTAPEDIAVAVYTPEDDTEATPLSMEKPTEKPTAEPTPEPTEEPASAPSQIPEATEPPAPTPTPGEKSSAGMVKGDEYYSKDHGMAINSETGKDKYLTDPIPEGKPLPVEPQDVKIGSQAYTCTLSVRCDTILNNMKSVDKEKVELVPLDGVILAPTTVTFYEGESVFNLLQREMKRAKIHMEFRNTPIYNSAYIEGINNLYEFDVGELSGWMYKVNGWFPNYGCSRYSVQQGDLIEWVYTCDLGRDVGGFYATGG